MPKFPARSPFLITLIYFGIILVSFGASAALLYYFPTISPFMVFLPAVLIVTWYAGLLPGVFTSFISVIGLIGFLFLPQAKPLMHPSTELFVEFPLFLLVAFFLTYIVDRAKSQEEIISYQKQIRQNKHLIETLEKNYENAKKEIEVRDQFLAIASHELKTPVTSMLLQVQSAIHNIRNVSLANFSVANLLKMLEGTEQQSQRLSKMVNDLLNLSLITTGKFDLEPEEVDLSKIAQHVAHSFEEKLQRENTSITVHADKPIVGIWDKVRVTQAVTNLISNAIKYGDSKPIDVSVTNSNNTAKLVVKDHGIGISPDQQKRIFERFERAVSSREYQGLGVGLYITNQIVRAHQGKIHVESQPHNGTSFIIELPLKQSA